MTKVFFVCYSDCYRDAWINEKDTDDPNFSRSNTGPYVVIKGEYSNLDEAKTTLNKLGNEGYLINWDSENGI